MNGQGYAILYILFIIIVLATLLIYFYIDGYNTNKANQDLKTNTDEQNKIINAVDKSFYFKEADDKKDPYILDKCQMRKITDTNDLIILHNEGYE